MSQRIAILGLGLIGSSLARALKEKRPDMHIAAFDVSHEALAFATRKGFIDSQHAHAGQAAHQADIVMLATPPSSFATLAADITPFLAPGAVVTDAGSVKRHAVSAITAHLPKSMPYVPGHPIAGSEKRGVTAGRADLFAGRRVILTPEETAVTSDPVARVKTLWEVTGARVEFMPAELHDRIYAYVSHLPQLVAFALRNPMQELPQTTGETGARFRRLMHSDPALWSDICLANADYISEALDDFATFMGQMEGELSETPAAGGADAGAIALLFPRVIATCLIATASLLQEITGVHPARYAGSGFADMTAPALDDPEAALEAISQHHWVIARLLKGTLGSLAQMRAAIDAHDKHGLMKMFGSV
jgi:cyclohexadieny/prephenate dehydrogenase